MCASATSSIDVQSIADSTKVRLGQVTATVELLDAGNTVPFITRYRKDQTGGLNEVQIRAIQQEIVRLRLLAERKQTILRSIESQGKLTGALAAAIEAAENNRRLDDLYLPFKPKKQTLATLARERGLEPLAREILAADKACADLDARAADFVNPDKQVPTAADALLGAGHIIAEQFSEHAELRRRLRNLFHAAGKLVSKRADDADEKKGKPYADYFDYQESIAKSPPHRTFAINRGERSKILRVRIEIDPEAAAKIADELLLPTDHPHLDLLGGCVRDALSRLLLPSLEREIRRELTDSAEEHAIGVFARNLRNLLLQPPVRSRRVLAVDPGFRSGCKLAALDEFGKLLEQAVVHIVGRPQRRRQAKATMAQLIARHRLSVVAIGNGTACRETEQVVAEVIAHLSQGEMPIPGSSRRAEPKPSAPPARRGETIAESEAPEAASPKSEVPESEAVAVETIAEAQQPAESCNVAPETSVEAQQVSEASAESESSETESSEIEITEASTDAATPDDDSNSTDSDSASEPSAESEPTENESTENESTIASDPAATDPAPPEPETVPCEPIDVAYVVVNEAGASVYSTSAIGREEFPEYDATLRGAISIGRRLLDPLSELVKIDPQNIGVGLYQHDVKAKQLRDSLDEVVESCVNYVGVDLNTASPALLRYVSGLNQLTARRVFEYRNEHGPFRCRQQLMEIPGLGDATFVQAAGFLRITGGENPLDATWIHPESYDVARHVLEKMSAAVDDLTDRTRTSEIAKQTADIDVPQLSSAIGVGERLLRDLLSQLGRPGRDPREGLPAPVFKHGVLKLEDLCEGMELRGTVLNVVDFGVFVDVGLHDSGLVHVSQLANRFVRDPHDVAAVGDVVTVWVTRIDKDRRRVGLTMIDPNAPKREPRRRPPKKTEAASALAAPAGESGQSNRSGNTSSSRQSRPPRRGKGRPQDRGKQPARSGGRTIERRAAKPLVPITEAMKKGREPMRTFGDLKQFFDVEKSDDQEPPKT